MFCLKCCTYSGGSLCETCIEEGDAATPEADMYSDIGEPAPGDVKRRIWEDLSTGPATSDIPHLHAIIEPQTQTLYEENCQLRHRIAELEAKLLSACERIAKQSDQLSQNAER